MEPGSRPQDRPTSAEVLPQVQGFRGPCLKTVLISFLCPGTASSHEITVAILSPPTPFRRVMRPRRRAHYSAVKQSCLMQRTDKPTGPKPASRLARCIPTLPA